MLEIRRGPCGFEVYDDMTCIYKIMQEEGCYVLKNVYDRKVAVLRPSKDPFSFFPERKKTVYDFIFETRQAGTFCADRHAASLEEKGIRYICYSGRLMGKDMLIGYEDDNFIFQIDHYDERTSMFLKQPEYAVYASLYFGYFMFNGKRYSESDDFLSHLPEDMMSFV